MEKIAIGSDHAGFLLKEKVKQFLLEKQYLIEDLGCDSEESVDYPDYGQAVGEAVVNKTADRGIVICGTGIGISIAANKVPGIRAALCHDLFTAQACREHNNANVLAMGARVLTEEMALQIVACWLTQPFAGERHQRRIDKIAAIEQQYNK